mgnify:CR=1 FL=1
MPPPPHRMRTFCQNMLCPAGTPEAGCKTPVFRMLGLDPLYGYDEAKYTDKLWGCPTMEPVWGPGSNPDTVDWYLETYYKNPCLTFSQMTTGQENSFGWQRMKDGLEYQMPLIAKKAEEGTLSVMTLGESGRWYKSRFDSTPAATVVGLGAWRHPHLSSVWYYCKNYRVSG